MPSPRSNSSDLIQSSVGLASSASLWPRNVVDWVALAKVSGYLIVPAHRVSLVAWWSRIPRQRLFQQPSRSTSECGTELSLAYQRYSG